MIDLGIYLTQGLTFESGNSGINVRVPRGVQIDRKFDKKLRHITIDKSLDGYTFTDNDLIKLNKNLKKLLGETLSEFKFLFSFERQEALTTKERMDFFKKVVDDSECMFATINLEEYIPNKVIFLNNTEWIHADFDNPHFFDFWKYIKRQDLGTIKKKFMFLNNHFSNIRFDILKHIYKNNKQNEGNISFNYIDFEGCHLNKEEILNDIQKYGIQYPSYYDALPTLTHISENEISRKNVIGINHVGTLSDFNYRIFLEAFFEIITETAPHLTLSGVHISEKIHKPFRTATPFIYYGNPKVKTFLEYIGFTFESPIYFFGMNEEFFNHLDSLLSKDLEWFHETQLKYLDEYFSNMDKWINFVKKNNNELVKYMYL